MQKANKARNQKLMHDAVATYRTGVEAWWVQRAPMIGYGTDISLQQLDAIAKTATRTANFAEEARRARRRGHRFEMQWWDSDLVRKCWDYLWTSDDEVTSLLPEVAWDQLIELDDDESKAYHLVKRKAHELAVGHCLIGAKHAMRAVGHVCSLGTCAGAQKP